MRYYLLSNDGTKAVSSYGRLFHGNSTGIRTLDVDRIMTANLFTTKSNDYKVIAFELLKRHDRTVHDSDIEKLAKEIISGYTLVDYSTIEKERNFRMSIEDYRASQYQTINTIRSLLLHIHIEEDDDLIEGYLSHVFKEVEDLKERLKKVRGNK